MADNQRTKTIALIAAGVVVALLVGVAAGWFARQSSVTGLEKQVADLEDTVRDLESRSGTETTEATPTADVPVTSTTEEPPATTEQQPSAGEGSAPTGPYDRQPGMVVDVANTGGTYVMRIDYVQFLTGGEAADAAAAHGDDSPPPNDYYVVNDNPKIRDFPIQAGIPVFVVTNDDGTSDADGHTITLAQWVAALSGPEASTFKASIYWITLENGIITEITAQYVP